VYTAQTAVSAQGNQIAQDDKSEAGVDDSPYLFSHLKKV
jgi:hypothetical protein